MYITLQTLFFALAWYPFSLYPQIIWEEASEAFRPASTWRWSSRWGHHPPQHRQHPEWQHKLWSVQRQGRWWAAAELWQSFMTLGLLVLFWWSDFLKSEDIGAPEPDPVPVVEKPVRSRGKTPVTVRTSSRRQTKVRNVLSFWLQGSSKMLVYILVYLFWLFQYGLEETSKKASDNVVEDILANEVSTPTGIR